MLLTITVDDSQASPRTVYSDQHAVEIAVFSRDQVPGFSAAWQDARGAYLLLGPRGRRGGYQGYAGSAVARGLPRRISDAVRQKQFWVVGLAVRRTTDGGFTAGQAAHIETCLYQRLDAAHLCDRVNGPTPQNLAVPDSETGWLPDLLAPVDQVVDLLGYSLAHQAAPTLTCVTSTPAVTVRDLIDAGLLHVGESLWPAWKPDGISPATVLADGSLLWDNRVWVSPSTPARKARGWKLKTSGWQYWSALRGNQRVPLGDLRAEYRAQRAA